MYLEENGQYRTDSLFVERIAKRHKNRGLKAVYCLNERQAVKGCEQTSTTSLLKPSALKATLID